MGDHLTSSIIKLKERGVISKAHAETMLHLAKLVDNTPTGRVASKTLRYMVVNAIAELLSRDLDDR
jgi:hypothetical protein